MTSKSRKKRTRSKKRIYNTAGTVIQKSANAKVSHQAIVSEQVTPIKSLDNNKITPLRDNYVIYELKRIGILAGIILIILITLAFVVT